MCYSFLVVKATATPVLYPYRHTLSLHDPLPIGTPPVLSDPARQALGRPSQMLMAGVARGLVRLDATGQVEPGIAERWIVIDDGMSYIFRIGDVTWPDVNRQIGRASCRERVCQYV